MIDVSDYAYENWINQFKSMNKLTEKLQFIVTILNSLNSEGQKKFHSFLIKFEKIMMNHQFMRMVQHRDAMVNENPVEYFGKDYGFDDPFKYNKDLEYTDNNFE